MSNAVYLVQNLQALWRADRSTHVLAGFSQLFGRDIVALSQVSKKMNQQFDSLYTHASATAEDGNKKKKGLHTSFQQMIRLLVFDSDRPPRRFRHFRVRLHFRIRPRARPSAIVRIVDLLPGLDELDECLGDDSAIQLLKCLERFFIILLQPLLIVDSNDAS